MPDKIVNTRPLSSVSDILPYFIAIITSEFTPKTPRPGASEYIDYGV